MENTKLIQILKTFSKREFTDFGRYVYSPYFIESDKITSFYELLKKHYPEFQNNELNKENVFRLAYPHEKYNDKKTRDLFSRMIKIAEDFLGFSHLSKQTFLLNRHTLLQLGTKNLAKPFEAKAKEIETILENKKIKDNEYLYFKYLLSKDKRNYYEIKKPLGKRFEFFNEILNEITYFNDYFILKILKYYSVLVNHEKTLKYKFDAGFLDEIIQYVSRKKNEKTPSIVVFYYLALLNKNPADTGIFYSLKKLLAESYELIEKDDMVLAYTQLYNYTKMKSIEGNREFKKQHFEIIREMIRGKFYPLEDNYMPESTYMSLAGEGMMNKDFEWTEKFINEYKNLLPPEKRENAYLFSSGILNYRKGNYGEALNRLARVSIEDFYYHLRVKNNLLRIHYEMGELENSLNIIDSFRHFLSSNKFIPEYIRIRFVNYVNFLSRLVNARLNDDKAHILILKNEIKKTEPSQLENGIWLMERIDEMGI